MTFTRILTQVLLGAGMLLPCLGQSPVPPVHLYPAAGERLRAPNLPTLVNSSGMYRLTWTSPDQLKQTEYVVNTNPSLHGPNVADGVLNVTAVLRSRANANDPYASTEFQALSGAGLSFRTSLDPSSATAGMVLPNAFAASNQQSIVSFGHSVVTGTQGNADTLVLTYEEAYAQSSGPAIRLIKEYKLRLFGRCLRIAATGKAVDATGATVPAFLNNYTGWSAGTVKDLTCAKPQHVPYMDSVPVLIGGQTLDPQPIWSAMVDWNRSNATVTHPVDFTEQGTQTGGCFNTHRYEIGTVYGPASTTGSELVEILRPVSEVVYLTVTDAIEDTFPVIDRPASPYRAFLAPKLIATHNVPHYFSSVKNWAARFFGYDESAPAGARGAGMDDALLIKWDWASVPQHLLNPTMLPVCDNPLYGSLKALTQLVAARSATTILYFYRVMDQGYSDPSYTIASTNPPQTLVLSTNPNYDANVITKRFNGDPQLGWTTYHNLEALDALQNVTVTPTPSEIGDPHPTHIVALSEADEVLDQLAWSEIKPGGPGGCPDTPGESLQVSGLHLDAEYEIPGGPEIDHTKGSTKGQSIGENILARAKLFSDGRTIMQGPLFSENAHWRSVQYESYMAGLLDGVNRKIAIPWVSNGDPEGLPPHSNYFVLPDYELRHVQPKSAGFYGMGYEEQFKPKGAGLLTESWADEWYSTIVTYGHSGHILFNGDETNTAYWTREATVKSYYLLSGLQSMYHLRPVEIIEYFPNPSGPGISLSELVKSNVGSMDCADLCAPRLHIRYRYGGVSGQDSSAGLDLWVNHAETDWTLPTYVAGLLLTLPSNGFVAYSDPVFHGTGLFAYTGYHPDTYDPGATPPVKDRVEYVLVPGQYEMLDRRGKDQTFPSLASGSQPFPDSAMLSEAAATFSAAGLGASAIDNALFVSNHVHGMRLYAYDSNIFDFQGTTPGDLSNPVVVGLEVSPMDSTALTIAAPERGLTAKVVYDNGARRTVTSLATWSSSNPTVASVNVNGVVARRISAGGPITISASYGGFSGSIQVTCPAKAVVEQLELSSPAPHSYAFECRVDAPCQFVELSYKLVNSPTFTKQAMHGAPSGRAFGLVLANLPPGDYLYFVTVTPRVGFGPAFNYPNATAGFTAY